MKLALALLAITALPTSRAFAADFAVKESDDTIEITCGGTPVLSYQKAVVPPPEGQPKVFARSAFIHPIHSPSGGVVTGIHPADHIHHMGLWHAWVKTKYGKRAPDFWNLKEETGTVRYVKTLKLIENKDATGFSVQQEQVALPGKGEAETVVLRETFTITAHKVGDGYAIDHETVQENVSAETLELPAYRYGGTIAYRAPASWDKENSDYLTSEGKTRKDGHATRGRWCAMFGPTEKGDATLAILCHPENRDAPQRMRIWDSGKIFFNYVPIQETGWAIKPGEKPSMKYRLLVFDGRPDSGVIEGQWKAYAEAK